MDQQYVMMEGQQYPITPGQQYPITPGQQYPITPGQQYPITPGQQYPVTPGQQYPITPGQQYPITPVEWPQAIEEFADLKTDSGCPIRAIIIGGAVALFLCLVIGIILLGIVNSKGTEEDPTEEDTTGGGGDGTSYIPEQYIALPNWSRKPSSSQARNRHFHFDKEAVICVYGTGFDESLQFPYEGMCDMTILDSLYKDGRNPFDGPYEKDCDHFIRHARKQTKDQFALSFDVLHYKKLEDLMAGNQVAELIQKRWSDRIFHYAMIDISPYEQSESDVTAAVATMKKLRGLLQAQADKTNDKGAYIALGFSPISNQWNQYISTVLRDYKPDIFVLRGHYTLKNHDQPSCKMAPPNIYKHTAGFKVSMQDAHNALKQLAPDCGECAFAVSLTAAGRWNRPLDDFPPFRHCQRLPKDKQQLGSISEVCPRENFHHARDANEETMYAYSLNEHITMIYDNAKTMAFKLCSLKSDMTGVKYGIAVFDLQYEHATPQCGFPKFSRIEMAGRLTTYFKAKFNFPSNLTKCLELDDLSGWINLR